MRKGSWPYKVDQLLQRYEADLVNAGFTPRIRRLSSNDKAVAVQVPETNHMIFIGNQSASEMKPANLFHLRDVAADHGLESSLIFYRTDKPVSAKVYKRVRDEYSNFRTGPLSHYPSHLQQRMFSLGDRELAGKRFHPLRYAIVKSVRVPQFAYNLQDDDLSTIVMQQAVRNYDHLRGTDRWAYAQNDHNRPLDRVYLDTKRVNVTIADIVDRAAHNQLINGRQTTLF